MRFRYSLRARSVSWALAASLSLVATGALVVFLRPGQVQPLVPPDTNLLVITVDTLRADRLPVYGYGGLETPAISRLAADGVLFRWAFTPVPLTLPAHCSIFTGLLPFAHGVRDNGGSYLDDAHPTLAEAFKTAGFRTGAFVSAFVLDSTWGIGQGFDYYFDDFDVSVTDLTALASVQRPAGRVWPEARRWLAEYGDERFFLWLHLFDPHSPYEPPEPFGTRFATRPYDGEIAYVDTVIAELVAELERRALLDKTVVLFVSDHGEGLGDHEEDEHGLLAYDTTLRVPLILRLPDRRAAGTIVERPVSLVDAFPTLLELFGLPTPERLDGTSLVGLLEQSTADGDVIYAETLYPRLHFGWSELVSLRTRRFKYIRAPRPELYEYLVDPQESRNIADKHPAEVARLEQILDAMLRDSSGWKPGAVDPEAERRLRALGYVGGVAPGVLSRPGSELPDPKDKAPVYRKLLHAREDLATGDTDRGVATLVELLIEEPALEPAHRTLREHWIGNGEFEIAATHLLGALGHRPDDPALLYDLAVVYRAWKKPDEALQTIGQILDMRPDHVDALTLAGEILRDQRTHHEALERFKAALRASPESAELHVQIARTLLEERELDPAERSLDRALGIEKGVSGAHYLKALIAEQRGNPTRAEHEYRREIEAHPWDYQARFNLALLLGARRAFAEQIAMLESIPPIAPEFHEVHFYLAKAYLDSGDPSRFAAAIAAAKKGLRLAPDSGSTPLGHFVLADVYALQGKRKAAARELRFGQELEKRLLPRGR